MLFTLVASSPVGLFCLLCRCRYKDWPEFYIIELEYDYFMLDHDNLVFFDVCPLEGATVVS